MIIARPALTIVVLTVFPLLLFGGFFYYVETSLRPPAEIKELNSSSLTPVSNQTPTNEIPPEVIESAISAIAAAKTVIAQAEIFLEKRQKSLEVLREKDGGHEKAKGVYMTGFIGMGQGGAALSLRENIVKLIAQTELNALVVDVKESEGTYALHYFKEFVGQLRQKKVWTIARIVVFADSSLISSSPDLYCRGAEGDLWRDAGGRYWLDPANPQVQNYIIAFSKAVIDTGFDELQFDYIRFPAEGNLKDLICPFEAGQTKTEIIGGFFKKLSQELRAYNPNIVLSVDLFGLAAVQISLPAIGQDMKIASENFDYLSFMLYPSHFYGGFQVPQDTKRGLPALYLPYESLNIADTASNNPYAVVHRSLIKASDYIESIGARAKIRPWLQDFNLRFDRNRGIVYDAAQVMAQIEAAEDANASGWLLWNPSNVYTETALKPNE